jgi:membrane protein
MLKKIPGINSTRFQKLIDLWEFASVRIQKAQLKQVASSLTLTTLLSIVPALAVIMAAFTAFPLFEPYRDHFEQLLAGSFLPEQYSAQILTYVKEFAEKAAGLTLFGLIGLAVSALLCIYTIDTALNNTFEVKKIRNLWQRFLIYWALLSLGPMLIVLSLAASTYVTRMTFLGDISEGLRWLFPIAQWAVQGLALACLYKFVPNCRVRWRDALIGGFAIAFVLTVFRWGFGIYVLKGTYGTIYGAFAAIPVLLLWTYVMWMLLLAGAALVATLPILRAKRYRDFQREGNNFLSAFALLEILYREWKQGNPKVTDAVLAAEIGSYPEAVSLTLERLEKYNYVGKINDGGDGCWVLLADVDKATLTEAFEEFCIDRKNSLLSDDPVEAAWIEKGLQSDWLSAPLRKIFS